MIGDNKIFVMRDNIASIKCLLIMDMKCLENQQFNNAPDSQGRHRKLPYNIKAANANFHEPDPT